MFIYEQRLKEAMSLKRFYTLQIYLAQGLNESRKQQTCKNPISWLFFRSLAFQ